MQNFSFCGSGWSFWYLFLALFCHFFMQKLSFLRGWEVSFSKKRHFFRSKLQFLRGWVVFLSRKNGIFLRFFRKCAPNSDGPASAAVRVLTAVNADSLCTLAGGWRSHDNSSLFQSSHASARSARARTSRVAKAVWEKPVHPGRWVSSLFRSSLPTSYSAGCR